MSFGLLVCFELKLCPGTGIIPPPALARGSNVSVFLRGLDRSYRDGKKQNTIKERKNMENKERTNKKQNKTK